MLTPPSALKRALFIVGILTLTCFIRPVFAEWKFQYSGTTDNLYDICFVDEYTGWAVGDNSTIIHTVDGGETWAKQKPPIPEDVSLKYIAFVDTQIGYSAGEIFNRDNMIGIGYILKTIDGGRTWHDIKPELPIGRIWSMSVIDSENCWISSQELGYRGLVYHTADGGKSWHEMLRDKEYRFSQIIFADNKNGFGLYAKGVNPEHTYLIYTRDGGVSWHNKNTITSKVVTRLWLYSPEILWAGYNGFWHSRDGGFTLENKEYCLPGKSLRILSPITPETAYCWFSYEAENSNYHQVLTYTRDGGNTHDTLLDFSNNIFFGWAMSCKGDNIWIVGEDGKIIKYTKDTTVTVEDTNKPHEIVLHQNHPNPFNASTAISFDLKKPGNVTLEVYNVSGQKIVELLSGALTAGKHTVHWQAKDDTGAMPPSGIYFYTIRYNNRYSCTKRMLLIK